MRIQIPNSARSLAGHIQTLLVFAILAAVGIWGHRTGWKAPKFSDLRESPPLTKEGTAEVQDWCSEHSVPESRCIKCNPELLGESAKDWCAEHGVPESKCTLCHPEILKTGVAGDWCAEHGVPESSCTLCHPEIAVKGKLPPQKADIRVTGSPQTSQPATNTTDLSTPAAYYHDEDEDEEEDHHGHEHTELTVASRLKKDPATCQTHALRVQFASAAARSKAGVQLGQVTRQPMRVVISAPSEIEYNRTHYVQISTPVSGRVWRVDREVGQPVKKGDILALIDSAEVGKYKAELLEQLAQVELANKKYDRQKSLAESASQAALQEADAALKVARIRLFNAQQALANLDLAIKSENLTLDLDEQGIRFLGLSPDVVKTLEAGTTTANLVPLRAPIDGAVLTREIVAGEIVEAQKVLFTIADTRHMWAMIDIPQLESSQIRTGQRIMFRPDGVPDQAWPGQITWVSTEVDDQTRTVRARAEIDNADRRLLAHTFGSTDIVIRETESAIVVPTEAIQWEGCCHIVFVRLADEIFQVRKIQPRAKDAYVTEIEVGLLPGEVVTTIGSHVLTSEILKTSLGAGCCAVE